MGHGIQDNDFMFSGNNVKAWHGLGATVEGLLTASEALQAAKLNWLVEKKPIMVCGGKKIPDMYATIRNDDHSVLGVVGANYHVLQNADAFNFFDPIAERGDAIYETAGSLFGGRRVFITAKIPGLIRVGTGEDVSEKYILLSNSHDGSTAVQAKLIVTRVVCNNTLTVAMRERGDSVTIRHSALMAEKLSFASEMLGVANKKFVEMESTFNAMRDKQMTESDVRAYLNRCFNVAPVRGDKQYKEQEGDISKEKRAIAQVMELHESGLGSDMVRGTLWGAFNAITEFTNHHRTYKQRENGNDRADNKLNSLFFGQSASLGDRALNEAVKLLRV
jgi:phage/plasmid-like protein (TIGR03299 family)